MKKGTKLYSILREKCPHCQEANFFEGNSVFNLKQVGKIHRHCPACGRSNHKEPGFYYGALYVVYGMGVGLFVATFIAIYFFSPETELHWYVVWMASLMIILGPKMYKISRIVWANMFYPYQGPVTEPEDEEATLRAPTSNL